jgi:hypothetical protein
MAMKLTARLRDFTSAHPALATVAALAALILIASNWQTSVVMASVVAVVAGLAVLGVRANDYRLRRRQAHAAIAARADDQDQALIHGNDQWGVFGVQPPNETMTASSPWSAGGSRRPTVLAGLAVVAGVLGLAVMAMVGARSSDRAPQARHVTAPTVTVTAPASRPIPHSMNPTPAQAIPAPAVRMGQPAVDGPITFVVTSVNRSKTVSNPSFPFMQSGAKGTYLTAELTITNNGGRPEMFMASYQRLNIDGAVYAADPAAALWTMTWESPVSPGTTVTAVLSFDVPTDTPPGGVLQLHGSSNSLGADVELLPSQ